MNKLSLLLAFIFAFPAYALHVKSEEAGLDLDTAKISHIYGPIDRSAATRYADELTATSNQPGARIVLINSPGGYATSGDSILALMRAEQRRGVKQVCIVMGDASSMAFNILTHCDVRLATKAAHFLVHTIYYESLPSEIKITARNLREIAAQLDRDDAGYRRANARAMHLSFRAYDDAAAAETVWSASQLRAMKYLDGIVKTK